MATAFNYEQSIGSIGDTLSLPSNIEQAIIAAITAGNATSVQMQGVASVGEIKAGTNIAELSSGGTINVSSLPSSLAALVVSSDAAANLTISDASFDGVVVLNNDAANKVVVNSNQDIVVQGGDGDDSISTASGADSVVTGTGNDSVTTGAGGDEVTVSASKTDKDTVDTGTGVDRVILQGDLSASDVGDDVGVTTSGGDLVITLPSGQSVTVKNGEIIEFADGTAIAAVKNDTEAAVMRLYEGFIGRPMDADGAAWWLSSLRDNPNKTIQDVVRAFAGEAETQAIMNSRTNNLFLDALYNKAFGRSGDEAGTEFWLSQLASGKASRVDLVASFMFSSEAEATIVGVIEIPGSV